MNSHFLLIYKFTLSLHNVDCIQHSTYKGHHRCRGGFKRWTAQSYGTSITPKPVELALHQSRQLQLHQFYFIGAGPSRPLWSLTKKRPPWPILPTGFRGCMNPSGAFQHHCISWDGEENRIGPGSGLQNPMFPSFYHNKYPFWVFYSCTDLFMLLKNSSIWFKGFYFYISTIATATN